MRVGSHFIAEAARKHERFLAIAFAPSYKTLDWLSKRASANYTIHDLGIYSGIKVLEFDPRVPGYSALSAFIGSTVAAFREGSQQASQAVTKTMVVMAA